MRRSLRLRALLFALLLNAAAASPVQADAPPEDAKALFAAGVAASEAEHWEEARDAFKRSLALVEKPSTLFNLGVAEVMLGMGSAALATFDAFDRVAQPALHGDMIERSKSLRLQAEQLAQAEQAKAAPAALPSAPPPAPPEASQDTLASTREDRTPDSVANTPAAGSPSEPVDQRSVPQLRTGRWLLAAGVVSAVGALGLLAYEQNRDAKLDRCEQVDRSADEECADKAQLTHQQRAGLALTVSLGAAAVALLVTGTVWLVRGRSARQQDRAARAHLIPSARGSGLSWSF